MRVVRGVEKPLQTAVFLGDVAVKGGGGVVLESEAYMRFLLISHQGIISGVGNAQRAGRSCTFMKIVKPLLPLAAAAVIGGGAGAVATTALHDDSAPPSAPSRTPAPSPPPPPTTVESPHDVYQAAKDSVAYITTQVGTGSGFVISDDGYIVTNAHVVEGANGQIKAKIGDGKTLDAKLVGQDASTDLALLKVDASNLKPLALGDSSTVQVGDPAYAIGNPFGLDRTLTTGVISALQRQISSPNGFSIDDVLQTDAAINPGNSGGPLFNAQGQVIGVNSQIESTGNTDGGGQAGNVGIGFAIPSNTVKSVVSQLRATGKVAHAYLGVQTAGRLRRRRPGRAGHGRRPRRDRRPAARRRHHLARRQVRRGLDRAVLARRRPQGRRPGPGRGHPQRRQEVADGQARPAARHDRRPTSCSSRSSSPQTPDLGGGW